MRSTVKQALKEVVERIRKRLNGLARPQRRTSLPWALQPIQKIEGY